jgi:PAS domain S-box-containing protein
MAILETNNDTTERRWAEEALRESEEQWRPVFEHNPTMYFMVDAAGTILSVNPFGAEQLGYTVDELVGHSVLHVFYEADRGAVQSNVAVCFEQLGRTMSWEFRKVRKDGTVLWVRETAKAMLRKNRPVVLIVCEDITERKRAEEERQAHLWFLESMDRVNRAVQGTNDLEQMIGDVLDAVLSIFDCDRAWVTYPCDPDTAWWRVVMERTRPEFPGASALGGQDLPMEQQVTEVFRAVRASDGPVR